MTDAPTAENIGPARPGRTRRGVVAVVVRTVLTLLALWWFTQVVRQVDWSQVGTALAGLTALQIAALLVVVALRQTLNAAPLALFVPALGLRRAMANDLSANLVATAAPPPGDIVLRVAMFRSWGIDATAGMGGLTLNTLTYYVARFGAPLLGLVVAVKAGGIDPAHVAAALLSGVVALVVVAALWVATRGETVAGRVAETVARQTRRVVSRVDPAAWGARTRAFVVDLADLIRDRSLLAGGLQVLLVLSEGLLLVASMRFAGVPVSAAGAGAILVALLVNYPLTALPFAGLGVLDAAVLATLALDEAPWEANAVAGMVVFRACWQLLPLGLGAVTLFVWRRGAGQRHGRPAVAGEDTEHPDVAPETPGSPGTDDAAGDALP